MLGISRSSLYYETSKPSKEQLDLKETIMGRIDYWHTELPSMGSRKITKKLRDEGYIVGRKLVRSYMREMEVGRKILCKRFSTKSRNDANMDGTARLTSLVYLAPSSLGWYARRGVNAAPRMRES